MTDVKEKLPGCSSAGRRPLRDCEKMGTQFDPECAKVLLEMMDEDKDYQMREH